MAQFYVEKNNGEWLRVEEELFFAGDAATGDYAVGESYSAENSLSNVKCISRMPSVFRVYSRQYDLAEDGVYVHPYNHYRVDFDDPNCIDPLYGYVADPDDPFWPGSRIVESPSGDQVLIVVDFDLGYDSPDKHGDDPTGFISVKGVNPDLTMSGSEYPIEWVYNEDIGLWAWGLIMPSEAVLIEAQAPELTTYVGEEFVDTYDAFYIHWGAPYASSLKSTETADADFELKGNTLFDLRSKTARVPDYTYDNRGVYAYDNGQITFDMEGCRDKAGRDRDGIAIQGDYDPDAWVMTALDPAEGGLDNTYRYFFTVKKSAGVKRYTAASNENGNRFLIELMMSDGSYQYWYYDAPIGQRTLSSVEADFSGKSIGSTGASAVIYSEAGEPLFKYSVVSGRPSFMSRGSEAGTYADASGSDAELVLDGFGSATYDGSEGTYTIDNAGMRVTFVYTDGTGEVTFIIYKDSMTYSRQESAGEDVSGTYSTDDSYSYTMRVTVDAGAGTADFYFQANGETYYDVHDVDCVWDSENRQITLSGFVMGVPGAWYQSGTSTVEFSVAEDGGSLVCNTAQLQHTTKGPSTCINVGGTVLNKE